MKYNPQILKNKLLYSVVAILFLTAASPLFSQINKSLTVQGGYSWVNGVIGIEGQLGHFAISAGFFPAKMPGSGELVPSFSGAFSAYSGQWHNAGLYASIGVASAGYRVSINYGGTGWADKEVKPMGIAIGGIKYYYKAFSIKAGFGYGYCQDAQAFTWEAILGWAILSNKK